MRLPSSRKGPGRVSTSDRKPPRSNTQREPLPHTLPSSYSATNMHPAAAASAIAAGINVASSRFAAALVPGKTKYSIVFEDERDGNPEDDLCAPPSAYSFGR